MADAVTHATKDNKIVLKLKNVADAPLLTKDKVQTFRENTVAYVNEYLRKVLQCNPSDSLFLYVNQKFAPAPDVTLGNLYDCFSIDGKLNIHYAIKEAWG